MVELTREERAPVGDTFAQVPLLALVIRVSGGALGGAAMQSRAIANCPPASFVAMPTCIAEPGVPEGV